MTSKQKTAIATLVVSALVAVSAMFGVECEPDQTLIEDALGGESGSTGSAAPADLGGERDPGSPASSSESSGSTG